MDKNVRRSLAKALSEQGAQGSGLKNVNRLATHPNESIPITFDQEDMLLGDNRHDRPLYYTCYIQDAKVSIIKIDPGSAVNILPIQMMNHIGVAPKLLKETNVSIHGNDGHGSRALGKIKIKCQIGDMTAHPICYVVEARTTYSLQLGRPLIHENHMVPSMLHQCFKYVDSNLTVRR